jgi:small subunit ribosomal protein S17
VSAKKAKATPAKAATQARRQHEAHAEVVPVETSPEAPPQAVAPPGEAKSARTLTGRVVSNKMHKTIAVEIERLIRHPTYGKYIRRTTKLLAHDESGASREGDLVTITPCRPMSRRKSWRLLAVLAKAARG